MDATRAMNDPVEQDLPIPLEKVLSLKNSADPNVLRLVIDTSKKAGNEAYRKKRYKGELLLFFVFFYLIRKLCPLKFIHFLLPSPSLFRTLNFILNQ